MQTNSARRFFLARGKQRVGPFTHEQLKQMAATGMIQHSDMTLEEGQTKWQVAGTIEGIWPQAEPLTANPPRKSNAEGRYPVLQPGEDFFPKPGSLIVDPDGPPPDPGDESGGHTPKCPHCGLCFKYRHDLADRDVRCPGCEKMFKMPFLNVPMEAPPKLSSYLLSGGLIGFAIALLGGCIIGGDKLFSIVFIMASTVGAGMGAFISLEWYERAKRIYHANLTAQKEREQERQNELSKTRCPACQHEYARIEIIRGTILSGPIEIRPVLRT